MKKILLFLFLVTCFLQAARAGGILTNTNQSVHFARNPARGASLEIDGVYTNPAGLTHLPLGWQFSVTNQSAFQTRTITSTFAPFARNGGDATKTFKGTASAPIVPSVMGVYRIGDWAISGSFAVSGGGGKATFNQGLPSFESGLAMLPVLLSNVADISVANNYTVDAYMRGAQFIYGAQLGGTYRINEMFSVYGGFRLNIVSNRYEGHLRDLRVNPTSEQLGLNGAMISAAPLLEGMIAQTTDPAQQASLELLRKASDEGAYLDCSQWGWGISPILGLNFNYRRLNIGIKYELRTNLNVENKTRVDDTGLFRDGVNTPHDIPSLLTVGAAYDVIPSVTISAGYHRFFDSKARMDGGKQKYINGGTNEYLGGIEWRISPRVLISGGFWITRYGVTDDYQKDLSFSINSHSLACGGAVNISEKVRLNIGYFHTFYKDWTRESAVYNDNILALPGTDVFSRTNKVFAIGVDFRF